MTDAYVQKIGAGSLPTAENSGQLLVSGIDNKFHLLDRPSGDNMVLESNIALPQRMAFVPKGTIEKFTTIYEKDFTAEASRSLVDGLAVIDGINFKVWQDSGVPRGQISLLNGVGLRLESRAGAYIPGSTYNAPYVSLSLSRQQGLGAVTPEADYSTTETYGYEIMVKWRFKNFSTDTPASYRPMLGIAVFNNANVDPWASAGGDNQVTNITHGVLLSNGVIANGAYYSSASSNPALQDLKTITEQTVDVSRVDAFFIRDKTIRTFTSENYGADWPLLKNMTYRGNGWHSDSVFRQHFICFYLNSTTFASLGDVKNPVAAIEKIRIRSCLI